jgi:diguanylate cyclase (GGDEF)-like protein
LPNRVMLQERLSQEIAKAQRNSQKLAVLFIDLDKFKEVNDSLGHAQGDQLLREAARRIRTCVRASDTVARIGGDEFVVLLSELHDGRMASDVAQALNDQLTLPFELEGGEVVVSGSIGISLYPDDAQSGEGLLKNADQAMYLSKTRGRNQFSYFTRALEQAAQRRMQMIAQLRQALILGQFQLHFQPIVDMASGRIHKAEALIRWQHPVLGAVSPVEFIPMAEETGLIVPIGDWVFDEAVRWVKRWRETLHPDFQVSVNKSPVQFQREKGFAGTWADKLQKQGLPGHCVTMEITEGLLIGADSNVQATLKACREAGIEVAIDDFGTGYSSLAYLKRFEIDYVKIDRSFISNLAPDTSDLALTHAIIAMAHALKLKVVAEGVETELQRDLLAQAGCDFAQGYLFSRPMPPGELETLLTARRAL